MVHLAGGVLMLNFVVGKGGTAGGTPVDQVIPLVEKVPFVEGDKDFPDRFGEPFVQGKTLTGPVNAGPNPGKLPGNYLVVFVFDLPGFFNKFLPAQIMPGLSPGLEPPFHHILGSDPRMIGARHPKGGLPPHTVETDHDILEAVVKSMPQVKDAGYVGRGYHHHKRARAGLSRRRPEGAALFPVGVNPILKSFGVKGFFQLNRLHLVSSKYGLSITY
jgi:hypothetical protein